MKLNERVTKLENGFKDHENRLKFLEEKFKNIATALIELKNISLSGIKKELKQNKIKWIFWGVVIILLVSILGK